MNREKVKFLYVDYGTNHTTMLRFLMFLLFSSLLSLFSTTISAVSSLLTLVCSFQRAPPMATRLPAVRLAWAVRQPGGSAPFSASSFSPLLRLSSTSHCLATAPEQQQQSRAFHATLIRMVRDFLALRVGHLFSPKRSSCILSELK